MYNVLKRKCGFSASIISNHDMTAHILYGLEAEIALLNRKRPMRVVTMPG